MTDEDRTVSFNAASEPWQLRQIKPVSTPESGARKQSLEVRLCTQQMDKESTASQGLYAQNDEASMVKDKIPLIDTTRRIEELKITTQLTDISSSLIRNYENPEALFTLFDPPLPILPKIQPLCKVSNNDDSIPTRQDDNVPPRSLENPQHMPIAPRNENPQDDKQAAPIGWKNSFNSTRSSVEKPAYTPRPKQIPLRQQQNPNLHKQKNKPNKQQHQRKKDNNSNAQQHNQQIRTSQANSSTNPTKKSTSTAPNCNLSRNSSFTGTDDVQKRSTITATFNPRDESNNQNLPINDASAPRSVNGNEIAQTEHIHSPAPLSKSDQSGKTIALLKEYIKNRDADILLNSTASKQDEGKEVKSTRVEKSCSKRGGYNTKTVPQAILEQLQTLPIFSKKDELVQMIKENQVVIVVGDTGSGKSTQIPQYLWKAGLADKHKGIIGITQPRRVAAKSLAERVAVESGVDVGTHVGYSVRFQKRVSNDTMIKYMTDGVLLKELLEDSDLNAYSVIMVDEAHERRLETDICLGLLKQAVKKRSNLRIIISSATLQDEKFSAYFNNAPIFSVTGKEHDVEKIYREPQMGCSYIDTTIDTVLEIHTQQPLDGDILVFLTGQEEIETTHELLKQKLSVNDIPLDKLLILPCYSTLPLEDQQKIFEQTPRGVRKVVLATNIAETSLTIEGIAYVVDCGYFKQKVYNAQSKIESLDIVAISKFQAIQRAGRAGRTQPGKCYRLYSLEDHEKLEETNQPEIRRSNLESVLLYLVTIGFSDPMEFEFIDAPPNDAVAEALEHLIELKALNPANLAPTNRGRMMVLFPLDPPLTKVLFESFPLGCSSAVLTIIAMLCTNYQNLFFRQKIFRARAELVREDFNQTDGDHFTLFLIYNLWQKSGARSKEWCNKHFIQNRYLEEAKDIRSQLSAILDRCRFHQEKPCPDDLLQENIQRAFTTGYFSHLAQRRNTIVNSYHIFTPDCVKNSNQLDIRLHPSSALNGVKPVPEWVIFHELVTTSKPFMRGVMPIQPEWIKICAPEFANKVAKYGVELQSHIPQ